MFKPKLPVLHVSEWVALLVLIDGMMAMDVPAMMTRTSLNSVVGSSEFYPIGMNVDRRVISFTRVSRDAYRKAGFLVPKAAEMGPQRYNFNLDDLLLYDAQVPATPTQAHYILISAFCCSTLLARYLDMLPGCLVLKEPVLLAQLAILREHMLERQSGCGAFENREGEWRRLATLCLRLLTRTFSGEETAVIKAADRCNSLGEIILQHDPRTKILLLSVDLRTFVLSVLKSSWRPSWVKQRLRSWKAELVLFPALAAVDTPDLDAARASAYLWLVNMAFWNRLRKEADPSRVLTMDGEEVSGPPAATLRKVVEFFELPVEKEKLDRILLDPPLSQHSKDLEKPYDAASRRKDLAAAEKRFGAEVDAAIEWASRLQDELGVADEGGCVCPTVRSHFAGLGEGAYSPA